MNLPWAFKYYVYDSNVKYCDLLKDILKAQFVIFRCQKYVKKRIHGNEKINLPWAPLENFPGALGRSILHYSIYILFILSKSNRVWFEKYKLGITFVS